MELREGDLTMDFDPNELPENENVVSAEEVAEDTASETVDVDFSESAEPKKVKHVRDRRRLRYGTTATAVTAVVIAAAVLLNVIVGIIADRFPVSLDLSADRIYTLSDESKAIAEQVKEDMEIVVFYDESEFANPTTGSVNSVPEYDTAMKEFYNALKQYRSNSGNRISYQFINPDQEPQKFAAYSDYEVSTGSILFRCGERSRVCTLNDLYTIDNTDYYSYTFESNVEKVMASNVHILSSGEEHLIQVLVGHDEDSYVIDGLKSLYELNGYTFEEISITGSAAFNEKAEVMLIAAPKSDYTDAEIQRVQQWVYNDGNYGHQLMVFVNPTADCPNLYSLLEVEYKITVTDELILESDLNRVQNYSPLYTMADVPETEYTPNSACTGKLFTPQSRRLTTTLKPKSDDNGSASYGIQMIDYPNSAQLIRLQDLNDESSSDKVYNADDNAYPITSMIACVISTFNNNTQESVDGAVVVCGAPYMTYSDFIKSGSFKNEDLLLDTINSMTGAESAITISSKSLSADTVTFSGGTQLILGLGVFTVGLPVLVLVLCLVIFIRRKNL